jgi:hypothetical protein
LFLLLFLQHAAGAFCSGGVFVSADMLRRNVVPLLPEI